MTEYDLVEGEIIRTTERAVLVKLWDSDEEVWIPRSCCEESDLQAGDEDIMVARWFLEKEGLP